MLKESSGKSLVSLNGKLILRVDPANPNRGEVVDSGNFVTCSDGFTEYIYGIGNIGDVAYFDPRDGVLFEVEGVRHIAVDRNQLICAEAEVLKEATA